MAEEEDELARYDNPLITPTSNVMQIHFSLLGTVNALVAVSSFILILGLLRNKKVRSNSFNLFLLFMAIPDFVAGFLCFVSCAMGAAHSTYYSEWMCQFQSFYLSSTFAANAWMNAVIVHEVYKLIRFSHGRRRYFPPTRKQVFCRVAIVYTYGIMWGIIGSGWIPGLPIKPAPFYGLVCLPMEYDLPSTLFFYFGFVPGVMVIPMMYSFGVMVYILYKGLLPKSGRNRVISVFMIRLIALYFFFWMPCLLLKVVGNFVKIDPWYPWAGSVLSHFQGLFSSLCAIGTSDAIRHEVLMVLRCKCTDPPLPDPEDAKTMMKRASGGATSGEVKSSWLSGHGRKSSATSANKTKKAESTDTSSGSSQGGLPASSHGELDEEKGQAMDLEASGQTDLETSNKTDIESRIGAAFVEEDQ